MPANNNYRNQFNRLWEPDNGGARNYMMDLGLAVPGQTYQILHLNGYSQVGPQSNDPRNLVVGSRGANLEMTAFDHAVSKNPDIYVNTHAEVIPNTIIAVRIHMAFYRNGDPLPFMVRTIDAQRPDLTWDEHRALKMQAESITDPIYVNRLVTQQEDTVTDEEMDALYHRLDVGDYQGFYEQRNRLAELHDFNEDPMVDTPIPGGPDLALDDAGDLLPFTENRHREEDEEGPRKRRKLSNHDEERIPSEELSERMDNRRKRRFDEMDDSRTNREDDRGGKRVHIEEGRGPSEGYSGRSANGRKRRLDEMSGSRAHPEDTRSGDGARKRATTESGGYPNSSANHPSFETPSSSGGGSFSVPTEAPAASSGHSLDLNTMLNGAMVGMQAHSLLRDRKTQSKTENSKDDTKKDGEEKKDPKGKHEEEDESAGKGKDEGEGLDKDAKEPNNEFPQEPEEPIDPPIDPPIEPPMEAPIEPAASDTGGILGDLGDAGEILGDAADLAPAAML